MARLNARSLPHVPLHYFYFEYDTPRRRWFLFLWLAVIVLAVFLGFNASLPWFWPLEVSEILDSRPSPTVVAEVSHHYRSFPLIFNVFDGPIRFGAGQLSTHVIPLAIFLITQVVGWSLVLALGCRLSRWRALATGIIVILSFHFAAPFSVLGQGWQRWLIEVAAILSFLLPAVWFHLRQGPALRWRFLVLFIILAAWYALPVMMEGVVGAHGLLKEGYIFQALTILGFLFFISKEPFNLLVAATTNRANPARRLDYRIILGLSVVLLIIEFLLVDRYLRLGVLELDLGLRPVHLIMLSAIAAVFTTQNLFHQVKGHFDQPATFSYLILAGTIIGLGFLQLVFSTGDAILIFNLEKVAILFMFGVGLAQLFHLIYNFLPLLRRRVNLYFLLGKGERFSFGLVWLTGLVALTTAEALQNWETPKLFYHGYANFLADQYLLEGDRDEAIRVYGQSIKLSPSSAKANYNLAALLVAEPARQPEAAQLYLTATRLVDFPFAYLNAANLAAYLSSPRRALTILQEAYEQGSPSPYVGNNLALYYVDIGQPDSAIRVLKETLLNKPDLAAGHSNLARIYDQNGFGAEAESFHRLAVGVRTTSPAVRTNAYAYLLEKDLDPSDWLGESVSDDFFEQYNRSLALIAAQRETEAAELIMEVSSMGVESADVRQLQAYRLGRQDSLEYAISLIKAYSSALAVFKARSWYNLGIEYYRRNASFMAEWCFEQAGNDGLPEGLLAAARLQIENGQPDSAALRLMTLRGQYPELFTQASKELALLLAARGQDLFAMTEYDLNQLSYEDRILIGVYADSLNRFGFALNAFRQAQESAPENGAAYLELGRLYNRYKDSLAITNLEFGLDTAKTRRGEMQIELARAYFLHSGADKARKFLREISWEDTLQTELLLLKGEMARAEQDNEAAIEFYRQAYQQAPQNPEVILALGRVLMDRDSIEAAYDLFDAALSENDRNPRYWQMMGICSQRLGLGEDAAYSIRMAIELFPDLKDKGALREEFAELLNRFPANSF